MIDLAKLKRFQRTVSTPQCHGLKDFDSGRDDAFNLFVVMHALKNPDSVMMARVPSEYLMSSAANACSATKAVRVPLLGNTGCYCQTKQQTDTSA